MSDVKNSSLATNLVSYWELEEASGTRVDSHGSNDLTDNNTVGSATGIQGNGADFEAGNTEYLNLSGGIGLTTDSDISVSFWYKPESIGSFQGIIFTGSGTSGLYVRVDNDGKLFAQFANASGETKYRTSNVIFSAGTLYHVVVVFETTAGSNGDINFYINAGSAQSKTSAGTPSATGFTDGSLLEISTVSALQYIDGIIDEIGIWDRVLTTGEISDLYNSGAGIPYDAGGSASASPSSSPSASVSASVSSSPSSSPSPSVSSSPSPSVSSSPSPSVSSSPSPSPSPTAPVDIFSSSLATDLVSYWELEEASGTRIDSHGSNNLSDNNTVLSATGIQGNGADFEKSNSEYLSITDASQTGLDLTTNASFAWFMKPESVDIVNYYILSKGGATEISYRIEHDDDRLRFSVSSNGSTDTSESYVSSGLFTVGNWYHCAITWDNGVIKFYIDGSLVKTTDISGTLTSIYSGTGEFRLGDCINGRFFDGILDEVGVWSRTLTDTDIANLYNSGAGIPYHLSDSPSPSVSSSPSPSVSSSPSSSVSSSSSSSVSSSPSPSVSSSPSTSVSSSPSSSPSSSVSSSTSTSPSPSVSSSPSPSVSSSPSSSPSTSVSSSPSPSISSSPSPSISSSPSSSNSPSSSPSASISSSPSTSPSASPSPQDWTPVTANTTSWTPVDKNSL